jgi:hypothetical protein
MSPRWVDFARAGLLTSRPRRTARLVGHKLGSALLGRPWPLQADHVRLTEAELRAWAEDHFEITARGWTDAYLTFEMRRRGNWP